ncbi:hypothetical protein COLO4_04647 [Corchorus olitorius]|uniref:Uncharacterized protein n=1 Tax=Corchorus olitorius TaxID=93759 RepID=A0A1R3KT92_9ROSI|nr:hypothetical protein COLO4_04647 [Corchorus olitorius]
MSGFSLDVPLSIDDKGAISLRLDPVFDKLN